MKIVLEGPDEAGKSTLGHFLSQALGLPITHSGGPSKYPGEVNERTVRFNADSRVQVFDRHPAVSQNIYASVLGGERVHQNHLDAFYGEKPLIIYCRPVKKIGDHHEASEHSTQEYADRVTQNYDELWRRYDLWALEHASMIYRIGDSMAAVAYAIRQVIGLDGWKTDHFDPVADIAEFHLKFEQEYRGKPRMMTPAHTAFRYRFMSEELTEYSDATVAGGIAIVMGEDEADFVHQLELQFDSLIDLVYVALGTSYLQGFNFREGWRRVHRANMSKVLALRADADATDSGRDKRFDVVKPAGWQPPSHTDLLEDHAHAADFGRTE